VELRASSAGAGTVAAELTVAADAVVVAAGAWSGEVTAGAGRAPVGPRRGQLMRLGDVPGVRLSHIISGTLYLAPGVGGGLIVGATEEDCGFEPAPTLAGVLLLSAHASRMVPAARDAPVDRIWYGYRAATPDGRPVIGWSAIPGVLVAAGHGGQGILTAAVTGEAVAGLLAGQRTPWSAPFSPRSLEAR
jgi:glycine oxidase